ncbi:GreA/GreB family elongation factor [Deinococcus altitudinis]|uniref:GreA/GreB family elongation factor n=1 Tax=Deinococcus altitudinis TaxID=468914 RepID=UPI003892C823
MKSPSSPSQLTQDGYRRLHQQLERQRVQMDEARDVVREQMEANEAENFGLVEAQQHLAALEKQVAELDDLLAHAEVIGPNAAERAHVVLGTTALLTDLASGRTLRVRLVSPLEVGGVIDGITQVTQDSPVGIKLEGRRVGETFQVDVGRRNTQYQVTEVES